MTIKDGVKFGIGFVLAEGIIYVIARTMNDALDIFKTTTEENTEQPNDSASES